MNVEIINFLNHILNAIGKIRGNTESIRIIFLIDAAYLVMLKINLLILLLINMIINIFHKLNTIIRFHYLKKRLPRCKGFRKIDLLCYTAIFCLSQAFVGFLSFIYFLFQFILNFFWAKDILINFLLFLAFSFYLIVEFNWI